MYTSIGKLSYHDKKLVVEVDQEISDFYRSLIPKYLRVNQQRYGAHVSVVRNETPPNMEHWNKYQGDLVVLHYDGVIQNGEVYYWLNVFCTALEQIRVELGLPISSEFTRPPDGFSKCFHMTLGNCK